MEYEDTQSLLRKGKYPQPSDTQNDIQNPNTLAFFRGDHIANRKSRTRSVRQPSEQHI